MLNWLSIAVGFISIVSGIRAKSLLNDADMTVTREERENPAPSFVGRLSAVALGIALIAYGVLHILGR
ncbi:MAG: hypothetical protein ACJ73N_07020 [Bryobacteraceae bacterium]